MEFFVIYCILFIAMFTRISSEIIQLNDKNFQSKVPSYTILFVKCFVPWCDHCQQFEPEFVKASNVIAAKQFPVAFAEINCDGNGKETCEQYNVKGYPTIKVFNFGQFMFNYDGPKTSDSLVKFIRMKVESGSQKLKDLDDMSACLAGLDNIVIGFFHEENTELEKDFHKMADALKEEYKFAHTHSNKLMMTFGYRNEIVLFRSDKMKTSLEQSQLKFEGKPTLYNLRNWVASIYQGLAGHRTQKNVELFKAPLVVAYFDVNFDDKASMSAYYRNRVIMAARKFGPTDSRGKVTFAVSDSKEFKRELGEFGVKEMPYERERIIVTMRDAEERKYVKSNTVFSSESLEQFVNDVLNRNVDPYIKSEVPQKSDGSKKSYVATAVGKTFEDLVFDKHKDVLVQLFAPWSSDCRAATEILEKVAKKFHNETEIRVVKIDTTNNHLPTPYTIRGYPTVYLAKKNFKPQPLLYEGKPTVTGYIKFVAENATDPLLNYDRKGKPITNDKSLPVKTEL